MARVLDLGELTTAQGFVIQGAVAGDNTGMGVSFAGDVNGDGIDDMIVGAPYNDFGGGGAGGAWVVFGRDVTGGATAFGRIDLAALSPADGFFIQGDYSGDYAGRSVSGAGDMNGDGIDDVIIGAYFGEGGGYNSGDAWVVFGRDHSGGAPAVETIDLSELGDGGFRIKGASTYDQTGWNVSGAGEVNGDGIEDVIVGAFANNDGGSDAGKAFVIFGRDVAGGAPAFSETDLAALSPADGFFIQGAAAIDRAGYDVAGVGDVNGDGIDDLFLSAIYNDAGGEDAGAAYVIFGRDVAGGAAAFTGIDLANLAASDGFRILGDAPGDWTGVNLSGAGDVNGDGIGDLILGAPRSDDGGEDAGKAYVIFGRDVAGGAAPFAEIDLAALAASDGFIIRGRAAGDNAGWAVSAAGDVNADGFDDVIVGAYKADGGGSDAGEAYVIFGRDGAGGAAFSTIDLSALASSDGFIIRGDAKGDRAAISVAGGGDLNGDGIDDLIIGANGGDDGANDAGEAYVIFGAADIGIADPLVLVGTRKNNVLTGDNGNDTLKGKGGKDRINGLDGDDTLLGGNGNDRLFGGNGEDVLKGGAGRDLLVGGLGQDMLEGGKGADRFRFASVDESAAGVGDRIVGFDSLDKVDLTAIDANALIDGNQAFNWIGKAEFSGTAGELRREVRDGSAWVLGDIDGDGLADFELEFAGGAKLTAADFLL